MKVVAVTPLYPPHSLVGAWISTHELLRELVAVGHQVDVVQLDDRRPVYDLDGVTVHPFRTAFVRDAIATADVVVTHLGDNGATHRFALEQGVPSVRMVHGPFPDPEATVGAALVVFNSEATKASCPTSAPSIVVHPPVHPETYRTTPGDSITLVNLSEPKGVKVAWRLAEQCPDLPFLGVHGGYGEQITPRAPNFTVLPVQRDMRTVYSRTRVLLVPSLYESWGRVAVEAMCSGIPVIAHPTPGLREALGPAGLFVDRTDGLGWRDVVRALADPAEWTIWSQRSLARAAELDPAADIALFIESITALPTKEHHA